MTLRQAIIAIVLTFGIGYSCGYQTSSGPPQVIKVPVYEDPPAPVYTPPGDGVLPPGLGLSGVDDSESVQQDQAEECELEPEVC